MIVSRGLLAQPFSPARASEAPISDRNWRRERASVHSEAWSGNSRWSISSKAGSPASSSRLRQYCLPWATLSLSRSSSGSSGFRFIRASPMTRVATHLRLDMVLLHQPLALVGVFALVGHVEDLLARPDVLL